MCKQLPLSVPRLCPVFPLRPESRALPRVLLSRGAWFLLEAASVRSSPHQLTPQDYPTTVLSGSGSYREHPGDHPQAPGGEGSPMSLFLPVSLLTQSQLNDQTLEVKTRTDARLQRDSCRAAAGPCRGRPRCGAEGPLAEPECTRPRLLPPGLGAHVVAAMVHFSKNQLAFP